MGCHLLLLLLLPPSQHLLYFFPTKNLLQAYPANIICLSVCLHLYLQNRKCLTGCSLAHQSRNSGRRMVFYFFPSPHTVPGTENNVHSSQDSCEHSWSTHDTAAPSTALVFLPSVMLLNCNCGMRDFCCHHIQ